MPVSVHQDALGGYAGPFHASNLVVNPQNELFYGMLKLGLSQGQNLGAELRFTKLTPGGSEAWSVAYPASQPASSGTPAVDLFDAGFDAGGILHGSFVTGAPAYFPAGVYCYGSSGTDFGASAQGVASLLNAQDFLWPASDGGLYLAKSFASSVNVGCGTLAIPSGGALVMAHLTGPGLCTWSEALSLPAAAVKAYDFRVGGDGSLDLAVVYAGTIDFGGGPLQSAGTSSLAVARFDTAGGLLWAKSFGGPGSSLHLGSLSVNASGMMVLTAGYQGAVDLGGGPLPANADTFLAVLDASGQLRWSKVVTLGATGALVAAAGPCGLVLATSSPSVDLGTGPLSIASPPLPATIGVAALAL